MNVVKCVEKALIEWDAADLEAAMLHATIAVDGSAARSSSRSTKRQFLEFVRRQYDVIQVMLGAVTIDATRSRFAPLPELGGYTSPAEPDLADVIYAIHRCSHAHGSEVPVNFALHAGNRITVHLGDSAGIQLPRSIIIGLLAGVVLCRENRNLTGGGSCYLSWDHPGAGDLPSRSEQFVIQNWWGRKREFLELTRAPQSVLTVSPSRAWNIHVAHEDLPIKISY